MRSYLKNTLNKIGILLNALYILFGPRLKLIDNEGNINDKHTNANYIIFSMTERSETL